MISLSHLVGALLKDISQARMGSDAYSRDISRYYEQDPLLRGFSVPRADIESVEFELKFALNGARLTEARDMDSADRLRSLIDEYKLRTAKRVVDLALVELHTFRREAEPEKTGEAGPSSATQPQDTTDTRDSRSKKIEYLLYELQQLKQEMAGADKKNPSAASEGAEASAELPLETLWENAVEHLEGEGLKQASDAVRVLLEQLSSSLESDKKQSINTEELAQSLYRKLEDKLLMKNEQVLSFLTKLGATREVLSTRYQALVKPEVKTMLDRYLEAVKVLLESDDDCEVDVLFTAEQLAAVPQSAISSLKLRTVLRNYKWNEGQDETTNQIVRQLLPE